MKRISKIPRLGLRPIERAMTMRCTKVSKQTRVAMADQACGVGGEAMKGSWRKSWSDRKTENGQHQLTTPPRCRDLLSLVGILRRKEHDRQNRGEETTRYLYLVYSHTSEPLLCRRCRMSQPGAKVDPPYSTEQVRNEHAELTDVSTTPTWYFAQG